jgi:hypothetical protein
MAGYAASSRLQGAVPRFAGTSPSPGRTADITAPAIDTRTAGNELAITDREELVGRPLDDTIRDWLASIGESWAQLTFYLFDPNSWR